MAGLIQTTLSEEGAVCLSPLNEELWDLLQLPLLFFLTTKALQTPTSAQHLVGAPPPTSIAACEVKKGGGRLMLARIIHTSTNKDRLWNPDSKSPGCLSTLGVGRSGRVRSSYNITTMFGLKTQAEEEQHVFMGSSPNKEHVMGMFVRRSRCSPEAPISTAEQKKEIKLLERLGCKSGFLGRSSHRPFYHLVFRLSHLTWI